MIWKKKQFWGTIVAIALLVFCIKEITLSELKSLYYRVDIIYVILALLTSALFIAFKALRWKLIIAPQKKISVYRSVTLYSAGQVLNILMPALTGQLGRMFLFAKKEGLSKTFVFSTFVLEILFDSITLVLFLLLISLAFVFPDEYRSLGWIVAIVALVLLAGLYVFLHYHQSLEAFSYQHLRARRPGLYIGMRKFIRSFSKGIKLLRSSQHLAGSLSISLVFWSAHMLVVFFLFKAFGFELPLAAAATVMIVNTLALIIPITPGNVGTFEIAVSTSLAAFSVNRSDAVMFALAMHLLDIIPMWIFGAAFLRSDKVSIREIEKEHEDEKLLDHLSEESVLVDQEKLA
ncbi:MAG: lysylphosphatidylglycerol synthase transmembrane domain-containing protein [candidate division Zixibacteria bacterium]|nr:lysylphosphatidylglycerol synthase transmembrane domain-containing protein [candidate division Zixibacteria bacterium]